MILCDTGPLVALLNRADGDHDRCVTALANLPAEAIVTTWSCLTEAMYLLYRAGGFITQQSLWRAFDTGRIVIHELGPDAWQRVQLLMRQYEDAPMDLADASLVVAAEQIGIRRVFTIDRHFYAYRIHGRDPFEVIP